MDIDNIIHLVIDRIEAHPILALIGLLLVIYLVYINFFKSKKNDAKRDIQKEESSEEQNDEDNFDESHCDVCDSPNNVLEFEVGEDLNLREDCDFIYICKSCIDKAYPRETFHKEPIEESNEKDYNINDNYFEEKE